jgi:vancomycin resistance protein YoaR
MSTIYYPSRNRLYRPKISRTEQFLLAVAGGLLLFLISATAIYLGFQVWYAGRIYPGVSVAGVALGGLSPDEAQALLSQEVTYPQTGRIVLRDGDRMWVASPAELGLVFNARSSAEAAFSSGREGTPAERLHNQARGLTADLELPPTVMFDQQIAFNYLTRISKEIDRPTLDASLTLNGTEVVVTPGQVGREVDLQNSLAAVSAQAQSLRDGVVDLLIQETAPIILDAGAEADMARQILSGPLTLTMPRDDPNQPGPWILQPADLAAMLSIDRVETPDGPRYQVHLATDKLITYLGGIAPGLIRTPQNTRFMFNDDTHQLEVVQPGVIGRAMDVEKSFNLIQEQVRAGNHELELIMDYSNPAVTDDMTGEQLGVTELVSSYTSFFRGSSNERVQNITAAASKFYGLLVPPGATFSMSDAIGEITLDNGFAEALIIVGGQTIKGVGGGVCQVSTTLFRTAFFGGFPIVERYAHAYRVGYYEQNATGRDSQLAGLDATVFVPIVDFKFVNDSPYWLLMETYTSATSLTWKFYSTSDGRTVEIDSTGPYNTVPPPDPIYRENSDLGQGVIRQVDWAAQGAEVNVTRTVYRNGEIYFTDNIYTKYEAWADAYEYGPGTELPELTETPPPG